MTFSTRAGRLALAAGTTLVVAFAVGPAIAADHTVNIDGLEFQPAEITIAVGDTVTWEVTGSIGAPHSVTSGAPGGPDIGAEFDSGDDGLVNVGETFPHTFETAGTFAYYCTVHGASMSGQVVVQEAGASGPPAASEPPSAGEPPHEAEPIPAERKLLAAGVLVVTLVILFGAAAVWRRINPA